jgi:hypothetical protein
MMDLEYQQESQGETGILILCDKKHGWREDKKIQLKQENETQVEDTTNKISVIEMSKK